MEAGGSSDGGFPRGLGELIEEMTLSPVTGTVGGLGLRTGLEVLTEDETGPEVVTVVFGGSLAGEHLGQDGVLVSK